MMMMKKSDSDKVPISPTFYEQVFLTISICQKNKNTNCVRTEKLCITRSYKKTAHKMLIKLTKGNQQRRQNSKDRKEGKTEVQEIAYYDVTSAFLFQGKVKKLMNRSIL